MNNKLPGRYVRWAKRRYPSSVLTDEMIFAAQAVAHQWGNRSYSAREFRRMIECLLAGAHCQSIKVLAQAAMSEDYQSYQARRAKGAPSRVAKAIAYKAARARAEIDERANAIKSGQLTRGTHTTAEVLEAVR